ncbi:MAG: hypothetical protein ACOC5T_08025 [Elusimicrobiota bacterium]
MTVKILDTGKNSVPLNNLEKIIIPYKHVNKFLQKPQFIPSSIAYDDTVKGVEGWILGIPIVSHELDVVIFKNSKSVEGLDCGHRSRIVVMKDKKLYCLKCIEEKYPDTYKKMVIKSV